MLIFKNYFIDFIQILAACAVKIQCIKYKELFPLETSILNLHGTNGFYIAIKETLYQRWVKHF